MSRTQTFGLLALCSLMTFGMYCALVIPLCLASYDSCFEPWTTAVAQTAYAPYRYRVLSVGLEAALAPTDSRSEVLFVDAILHLGLFPLIYAGLYLWLTHWMNSARALIGCFVLAVVQPLGFLHYYLSMYSSIEVALLVWFLVALVRRWSYWSLVTLVAIAALNRETSLMLVLVYLAYAWSGAGSIKRAVGLFVVWAAITGGLRLALGDAPHVLGAAGTLAYNIATWQEAVFSNALFTPLWLLVWFYAPFAPVVIRRLVWVALLYLGTVLVGAAWQEVRLLVTAIPLVLPVVLMEGQKTR